ncbi:hypothetical protein ABEF95_003337 [Exophiala dermatitidis]
MAKSVSKNCDEALPICGRCERSGRFCDHSKPIKIREQKNVARRRKNSTPVSASDPGPEVSLQDPRKALQDDEIAQCFEHYLKVLSPWYDLNDHDSTFGALVAEQAQQNPLLLSAVVAFAAMHKARTGHSSFMLVADRYHNQCLRLLIGLHDYDAATKDGTALAATCLMREPILRAGLWNYMREDITFSLVNQCPLKIDLGNVDINPSRDDDYANQATLLLARIINAVFLDQHAVVEELQEALESWKSSLPFRPYHQSHGGVFPKILAAMHYFHVANMVLNRSEADPVELESRACEIYGLAFSANSDAVMVNAYGPISYSAGWLTRGNDRCEVVSRLLDSQKRTGWTVQAIIKKLKERWTGTDNFNASHFGKNS